MQPKQLVQKADKTGKGRQAKGGAVTHPPSLSNVERKALSKLIHIQRELASLYRSAKAGQIPITAAGKLAYILATLARIIEGSDLETRLDAIEAQLQAVKP